MDNGHTEVTLGDRAVPLRAITSHALVLDLVACSETNQRRAMVAALGMAWQGKGAPGVTDPDHRYTLKGCGFDVLDYGGHVYDELNARGHTLAAIFAAARTAWDLALGLLISEDELEGAEDFTSAQGEAST